MKQTIRPLAQMMANKFTLGDKHDRSVEHIIATSSASRFLVERTLTGWEVTAVELVDVPEPEKEIPVTPQVTAIKPPTKPRWTGKKPKR